MTLMVNHNIWFIADTHFGHKNVIDFCDRPFANAREMDEVMITRWNTLVDPKDSVYHLGDFALTGTGRCREILKQLNGHIHLICGNHDKPARQCKDCFASISDYKYLSIHTGTNEKTGHKKHTKIVLMHYAMRTWHSAYRGTWQLYGHSHGNLPDGESSLSMDVGVDAKNPITGEPWDFWPIHFDQVAAVMKEKKKKWKMPADFKDHGGRDYIQD